MLTPGWPEQTPPVLPESGECCLVDTLLSLGDTASRLDRDGGIADSATSSLPHVLRDVLRGIQTCHAAQGREETPYRYA
jgi:hypothetical protein